MEADQSYLARKEQLLSWLKQIERTGERDCLQGDFASVRDLDILKEVLEAVLRKLEQHHLDPTNSDFKKPLRREVVDLFPEALRVPLQKMFI